jgi:hypothetical protein
MAQEHTRPSGVTRLFRRGTPRLSGVTHASNSPARAAGQEADLRRPGPSSPLGPILASGTDETLELGRSRSDPVLIGDQRPQGRAPSPGPPELPGGLTGAQLGQDSAVLTPVCSAIAPALKPDPASTNSRSSSSADNARPPPASSGSGPQRRADEAWPPQTPSWGPPPHRTRASGQSQPDGAQTPASRADAPNAPAALRARRRRRLPPALPPSLVPAAPRARWRMPTSSASSTRRVSSEATSAGM